jgi:hypothetical protein
MSESITEKLEKQLKDYLGELVPYRATCDIHAALGLSKILESKGFTFQLKDLCPKSMNETQWRAIFYRNGKEFSADNQQSSVAVCSAAIDALASQ